MRAHPEMVGGTGREDTRLMQAHPELLVKGGAEGVHCAALPDGRCVAVKITDGGDRARMPVLVGALRCWAWAKARRGIGACWTNWGPARAGAWEAVLVRRSPRSGHGLRAAPPASGFFATTVGGDGNDRKPVLLDHETHLIPGPPFIGRPASYCKGVRHGARPSEG